MKFDFKNVTADTWARLILNIIGIINIGLIALGKCELSIDDNTVYTLVTFGYTAIVSLRCYWKNNSFTKGAQEADKVMKEINEKEVEQ